MHEPRPEDRLYAEVRSALSAPKGCGMLVLRLSLLPPPAPRPYHRRIALSILGQTAREHAGEVFCLGNGDMVVLCRQIGVLPMSDAALAHPALLPQTLARLFRADLPPEGGITSSWSLESDGEAVFAYVEAISPARS